MLQCGTKAQWVSLISAGRHSSCRHLKSALPKAFDLISSVQ